MNSSFHSRQRQLDTLITTIASELMGVPVAGATQAMERSLAYLLDFFSVDQTFLRRNRHEAGTSVLKAEWPQREVVPVPDPLYEVPFSADPIFGMCAALTEVFIAYPEDSEDYQERVKAGSGEEEATVAMVPLLHSDSTIGVLGLIRFGSERWAEEEVRTLSAIASLIAQMWGRHDAEETLAWHAHYDELTGLPNRRLLAEHINALDEDQAISVIQIDVDKMKVINDGLTYEAGDLFLQKMAQRVRSLVRTETTVARTGGDQFTILIVDSEPENVEKLAARLVVELGEALDLGGVSLARSVSIGVTHRGRGSKPTADTLHAELLKNAELAATEAKKLGGNQVAVLDDELEQRIKRQFEVELELRSAIDAGDQLRLHYQPEVDLTTGLIVAVEALMRWQHPTRGLLAAGVFIGVAEETGLIVDIGDFVLRESIAQLSRWQAAHPDLVMRVNVSPAQMMSRDLPAQIRTLVAEYGVDARRLCIEVTEHVMIADHEFTLDILNEVRAMGVKIALDDFGTGYSSMEQLKRLPIDALKIDRAFMIDLPTNPKDGAIVDATIHIANALGLSTVAEGIEEVEQVKELLNRGCHRAQGFLLAKPQPAEDVEKLFGIPLQAGKMKLAHVQAAGLVSGSPRLN